MTYFEGSWWKYLKNITYDH